MLYEGLREIKILLSEIYIEILVVRCKYIYIEISSGILNFLIFQTLNYHFLHFFSFISKVV